MLGRSFRAGVGLALARLLGRLPPARVPAAVCVAVLALLLADCGGNARSTPTPDPNIVQVLEKLDDLTEKVKHLEDAVSAASGSVRTTTTPAPVVPTFTNSSTPTPNPGTGHWVHQRLDALVRLYDFTEGGVALLRSLDLRQMRGEPGFFGSFGFKKWAGVGEAKPIGVIHELGHSYWGGFPIERAPELTWDAGPGGELSPAMQRYHADILSFMAQPPDDYELFRQRLRNLPELSVDNTEPLFHSLEADLIYSVAGGLDLVPPILRKYWSRLLKEGPFDSWYDAVAWYQSLAGDHQAAVNKYLGFEHLDLRPYGSLTPFEDPPNLIGARLETLAIEERQRLFDLADQFDLLLGGPQEEEKFQFWRGYLRDKVGLHRLHQGYLASLDLPRAPELALALEFFTGLSGLSPEDQAQRMAEKLPAQPFLVNFLPALENRALLELFSSGVPIPQGATLQATASFVDRLDRFSSVVSRVLTEGRADPQRGATVLVEFLSSTGFEREEDLRLFFELFRDEDPATAGQVLQRLGKATIRRLMEPVPAQLRFTLTPDQLLPKLDITAASGLSDLKRGVAVLVEEPSGNFIIDEPFLELMYEVIAARGRSEAAKMLGVLQETPFPLEGFISQQPLGAADLLSSDLRAALGLLRAGDPVVSPPPRIIHQLIYTDPVLAARLVLASDELGEAALVAESLAYLAYDKSRSTSFPGLPISLEQDGEFLRTLVDRLGRTTMARRLGEAFTIYSRRVSGGEVANDFLSQFYSTLEAATATIPDSSARSELQDIIGQLAGDHSLGR